MSRHYARTEPAVANPGADPEWLQHGHRAVCSCGFKGAVLLGDGAERAARGVADRHAAPHMPRTDDWIAR